MRVYANLRIKRYKGGIPASIDFSPTRGKLYATLSVEEIRSASEKETRGRKDITSDFRRVKGAVIKRDERERERELQDGDRDCTKEFRGNPLAKVMVRQLTNDFQKPRKNCVQSCSSRNRFSRTGFNSLFFLFFRDILSYQYTRSKILVEILSCVHKSIPDQVIDAVIDGMAVTDNGNIINSNIMVLHDFVAA